MTEQESKQAYTDYSNAKAAYRAAEAVLLSEIVRYLTEEQGHTVEIGSCYECGAYTLILMDISQCDIRDEEAWDKANEAERDMRDKFPWAWEIVEGCYPLAYRGEKDTPRPGADVEQS